MPANIQEMFKTRKNLTFAELHDTVLRIGEELEKETYIQAHVSSSILVSDLLYISTKRLTNHFATEAMIKKETEELRKLPMPEVASLIKMVMYNNPTYKVAYGIFLNQFLSVQREAIDRIDKKRSDVK